MQRLTREHLFKYNTSLALYGDTNCYQCSLVNLFRRRVRGTRVFHVSAMLNFILIIFAFLFYIINHLLYCMRRRTYLQLSIEMTSCDRKGRTGHPNDGGKE